MIGSINPELFGPVLINHLLSKEKQISLYTNNLLKQQSECLNDKKVIKNDLKHLVAKVFNSLSEDMIINICKVQFLTIFTYQETDNDTNYMLLPVTR